MVNNSRFPHIMPKLTIMYLDKLVLNGFVLVDAIYTLQRYDLVDNFLVLAVKK